MILTGAEIMARNPYYTDLDPIREYKYNETTALDENAEVVILTHSITIIPTQAENDEAERIAALPTEIEESQATQAMAIIDLMEKLQLQQAEIDLLKGV